MHSLSGTGTHLLAEVVRQSGVPWPDRMRSFLHCSSDQYVQLEVRKIAECVTGYSIATPRYTVTAHLTRY